MLWRRDEYLDHLTFAGSRREMLVELFGPLVGLEGEWRRQGATPAELDLSGFGFDAVDRENVRVNTGMLDGEEEVVLAETDEHVIRRDRYGRRVRLCKGVATIALPLDYPVTDMDSWLRIKPRYEYSRRRFAEGWAEAARAARDRGAVIVARLPGAFAEPRNLLGDEALCLAYHDQPELVADMLDTMGATAERVLDRVSREVQVDQLSVHEDLAGKSGPLVGPRQIETFFRPYYRRVWDMLRSRGARVFQQDSDGNVRPVIDAFLDAGLTCMFPMEPAAGMDIVQVRRAYGERLAMRGGIDKHVLRRGREAIGAELEYKLQPLMRGGGMVFGLDHRIPNGTPLEAYRYYVRTAREMLGLGPAEPAPWRRGA